MGCAGGCAKAILILLNIIVLLLGLALTALGALGLAGGSIVKTAISAVVQSLPSIADSFKFADSSGGSVSADEAADSIVAFLKDIAVPLLVIGLILTVVTFCGMCGACCSSKCLLGVYIAALVIILLALVILLPLYATGKLDPQIQTFLTNSVKKEYIKVDEFKALNLAWTVLMIELKCCGVSDYTDFYTDSSWIRNRTVTVNNVNVTVRLNAPYACCKMDGSRQPIDSQNCATNPNDTISNWNSGCFKEIKNQLSNYDVYAIGVIAGIIVLLVLLIIFAIIIIREDANKVV